LANTDHYTAWNARKRHLLVPGLRALDDEILLVDLLLSKHPKSGEAWCHRRWVLSRMQSSTMAAGTTAAVAAHEMEVCTAAARAYPRNYYAWTHRYWALSRLSPTLAAAECNAMHQWAAINTSDHAGLFYRGSAVLLAVANGTHCQMFQAGTSAPHSDGSQPAQVVWQLAWGQVTELQARYPGHESMWRHRRWLAWIAHAHAQSLGSVVDRETELQFSESREQEAMAHADKDGLGEREQRQWRSEALCASCYSRWARVALAPTGLTERDIG
jgi:protein prenyltransferase alpha subunit repeat containing protein 1